MILCVNHQVVQLLTFCTKGSHHRNLSVIFITQNLFHQGKGQRDISLNANYIVIFKNPRYRSQIQHLARQVCPENTRFFQEIYYDATAQPHGYLLLDLKQSTPENCRFRTCIFPEDSKHYVYVQRKPINKSPHNHNLYLIRGSKLSIVGEFVPEKFNLVLPRFLFRLIFECTLFGVLEQICSSSFILNSLLLIVF
ncbi:unnamed protein product [Chilo suppressalis]|uniref:Uncharacterized protein n=1 Tax=Chilo suppressalis TaxID=168631 RepID=A0ABN8B6B0_CHISP|nr:unnamed protein product [Chilo suppressalis]